MRFSSFVTIIVIFIIIVFIIVIIIVTIIVIISSSIRIDASHMKIVMSQPGLQPWQCLTLLANQHAGQRTQDRAPIMVSVVGNCIGAVSCGPASMACIINHACFWCRLDCRPHSITRCSSLKPVWSMSSCAGTGQAYKGSCQERGSCPCPASCPALAHWSVWLGYWAAPLCSAAGCHGVMHLQSHLKNEIECLS